jgi:hypothetical protein
MFTIAVALSSVPRTHPGRFVQAGLCQLLSRIYGQGVSAIASKSLEILGAIPSGLSLNGTVTIAPMANNTYEQR